MLPDGFCVKDFLDSGLDRSHNIQVTSTARTTYSVKLNKYRIQQTVYSYSLIIITVTTARVIKCFHNCPR